MSSKAHRLAGILSLVSLVLVSLWAVTLIWGMARGGVVETFDQALAYVENRDWLYTLTYVNAVLLTVAVSLLFGALYACYQPQAPVWAAAGLVLVPVYSALNLVVYASQVTIVPQLLKLGPPPDAGDAASYFLGQMVQAWPGSTIAQLNGLAYAILGIPSLIFGCLLFHDGSLRRAAGVLLMANAIACIAGPVGQAAGLPVLALGTVAGGLLFLLALFPLTAAFLRSGPGWTPS
jgi:hypothetical protein